MLESSVNESCPEVAGMDLLEDMAQFWFNLFMAPNTKRASRDDKYLHLFSALMRNKLRQI